MLRKNEIKNLMKVCRNFDEIWDEFVKVEIIW